jgi:type I restriction enzyme S subunit
MYERNRLYFDRFKQIKALLPPMEEQDQIVRYLDNKLSKINKFIKDKKKLIELLKEQKQVVIKQAVIKGLDPNVKMKPSGIEWLGDIPEGWKVKPMKYFAKIRNGKDFVFDKKGNIPVYGSGGKFSTTNKVMFSKPSVLLGRKGTIDKPILVKEPFWSVDTAFYTEIKENINLKYFYYLCCNIDFGYYVNGTALPSMTQTILNGIKLTCPPVSEQKRIIAYIESKTQIIDKAIDRINNEIDLMTEYRTSLTSNVITGKVDVRHIEVEDSIEEIEMFEALKKENIEE